MNLEAISIGENPPEDVNVIIEVPTGKLQLNGKGEPHDPGANDRDFR